MPSGVIKLVPGVNTDKTPSLNEAGISSSNLIRFRDGLVEKRGGWVAYLASALSGIPRALWAWRDFQATTWLAAGTTSGLFASNAGAIAQDITPRVVTSRLQNCFSTGAGGSTANLNDPNFTMPPGSGSMFPIVTVQDIVSVGGLTLTGPYKGYGVPGAGNVLVLPIGQTFSSGESNAAHLPVYSTTSGSPVISVSLQSHGFVVGSKFAITNAVTVGGLTIVGAQTVLAITDANTFTIQLNKSATASASATGGGGYVFLQYQYSPTLGQTLQGTPITPRDWSLGNYGQLLIACAFQGNIYQWQTDGAYITATQIQNAPQASGIIISDAAQQIIAYGGNPASLYDPNYIAWCDTGNPSVWTAAVGNQAGSYRIPTGSAIIGAATAASSLILLWTDVDVWGMQYVGYPIVYGFTKLASGCGLIGQFAWARLGGLTYWMSQNKFWVYDGSNVTPLACPVYDNVFPALSKPNAWKIRGGTNAAFGEVMWFFPSTSGSGENDMYVCFNPTEGTWDYGLMPRSAWVDQSVAGLPIGADPQGNVYQHETSTDAAGQPMAWSFTTGLSQVDEGEGLAFLDRIRPDFKFPQGVGTVQVSVLTYKYPGDAPVVKGPYSFTQATEYITTRCRGRYIAMRFSGSDLGSFWRIGRTQYRYAPDGRR